MRCLSRSATATQTVSIRTRSFDRVMHFDQAFDELMRHVSIRTRSFDRVMRVLSVEQAIRELFQSAPGLSTG